MGQVKFPFTKIGRSSLGDIFRPYISIEISSKKSNNWIPAEAIVDTGADYTLLPGSYAGLLAIDVNAECIANTTLGVGGSETIYLCKNLVFIKVGAWKRSVPVGFLGRDDVPMLIGRLGCLEVFKLIFENKVTFFEYT